MTNSLLIAVQVFANYVLMSFSVDKTLLEGYSVDKVDFT